MGLPVWRDPEEKRSTAAVARVKNDSTSLLRSPIRRLRASRPTNFYRIGQPPPVPEAPRQRVPPSSSSNSNERHFDLSYYLDVDNNAASRRSSSGSSSSNANSQQRRSQPTGFLPPPLERDRPQSRNGLLSSLPTPPLDASEPSSSSRVILLRPSQSSPHPLSFAHRPLSPDDGLGDRNRSPSPITDAWHLIGDTLTPDDSLPSTDSSFASNSASASFRHQDPSTQPTSHSEDTDTSRSHNHHRRAIEGLLYDFAMQTAEGRAQIRLIRRLSPEDTLWMRHHNNAGHEDDDEADQDEEQDDDEAPPREPSQYDSDIRERSRQVAASTLRFFGRRDSTSMNLGLRNATTTTTDTPPRSRSPSPHALSYAAALTAPSSHDPANSFLARSLRAAEQHPGDDRF